MARTPCMSSATIPHLRHLVRDSGVPFRLRTDGGPQFTSRELASCLERWIIRYNVSMPHYPQSKGHAGALVKSIKHLIFKVVLSDNIDYEAFDKGLLETCNTQNSSGRSPSGSYTATLSVPVFKPTPSFSPRSGKTIPRAVTAALQGVPRTLRFDTTVTHAFFSHCSLVPLSASRTQLQSVGTKWAP